MNKRGISPLIATVLIVGFTIVLAVLVIAWLSGVFETKLGTEECNVKGQEYCSNVQNLLDASASFDGTDTVNVRIVNLGTIGQGPLVTLVFKGANGNTLAIVPKAVGETGAGGTQNYNANGVADYPWTDIDIDEGLVASVEVRAITTPTVPGIACDEVACIGFAINVANT